MLPEEIEASHAKYVWKQVHQLDELHNELASLYQHGGADKKRIDLIWRAIDTVEMNLALEGVDYESYTQSKHTADRRG